MNKMWFFVVFVTLAGAALLALAGRIVPMTHAQDPQTAPAPGSAPANFHTAAFAAGCFWGVEETFRQVPGVIDTAVGYEGGTTLNPTYKTVCTDTTGHAETVQVQYDPAKVSYERLLDIFWLNHDPTTANRQGPDVGTQYRSVIFTFDDQQKDLAEKSKAQWQKKFRRPITTQIVPASTFWRAEEYHQRYSEKNGVVCHQPIFSETK